MKRWENFFLFRYRHTHIDPPSGVVVFYRTPFLSFFFFSFLFFFSFFSFLLSSPMSDHFSFCICFRMPTDWSPKGKKAIMKDWKDIKEWSQQASTFLQHHLLYFWWCFTLLNEKVLINLSNFSKRLFIRKTTNVFCYSSWSCERHFLKDCP